MDEGKREVIKNSEFWVTQLISADVINELSQFSFATAGKKPPEPGMEIKVKDATLDGKKADVYQSGMAVYIHIKE